MEDEAAETHERDHKQEFEWIHDVVADLRGRYVQAKEKSYSEAEESGAAKDGINTDQKADGDAPREFFGSCTHAQEGEDRKSDAAVDPVVVDGR